MGRKAKTPDIQIKLDDRFLILPSRARNAIRNSRLGHFGDEIFPLIDPDDLMLRVQTDVSIQYALHTTSFDKQPFSLRNPKAVN